MRGRTGKKIKRFNARNSNDLALGCLLNNGPQSQPKQVGKREAAKGVGQREWQEERGVVRSIYTCQFVCMFIDLSKAHDKLLYECDPLKGHQS